MREIVPSIVTTIPGASLDHPEPVRALKLETRVLRARVDVATTKFGLGRFLWPTLRIGRPSSWG
jgi:hypothetical protein